MTRRRWMVWGSVVAIAVGVAVVIHLGRRSSSDTEAPGASSGVAEPPPAARAAMDRARARRTEIVAKLARQRSSPAPRSSAEGHAVGGGPTRTIDGAVWWSETELTTRELVGEPRATRVIEAARRLCDEVHPVMAVMWTSDMNDDLRETHAQHGAAYARFDARLADILGDDAEALSVALADPEGGILVPFSFACFADLPGFEDVFDAMLADGDIHRAVEEMSSPPR